MDRHFKIIITTLVTILLITGCSFGKKKVKPTPKPTDQATKVLDDQTVEGLKISGFNITFDDKEGISTVVASVKNETEQDITLDRILISLYDKDNNLLVETSANIGENIKAGASTSFTSYITMDLRDTTKIEYKIAK